MRFFTLAFGSAVFGSVALSAVLEPRSMTAAEVVSNIAQLTSISQDLETVVSTLQTRGLFPDPSMIPKLVNGFTNIINTATSDIVLMQSSPLAPFTDPTQAQDICSAFSNFIEVHQSLLRVVIGKSGLLAALGGGPVASVLQSLEGVVDSLAYGIIDSVPTCSAGATDELDNLDATIKQAICAYTPLGFLGINILC